MNDGKIINATLRRELDGIRKTLQVLATKEGGLVIVEMLLQALKGDDGYTPVKDKDYFDGKTPQKGVDYWTKEEIEAVIDSVASKVAVKRGKDYWTKDDVRFVIESATKGVKVPKVGKDFYTKEEKQKLVGEVIKQVTKDFKQQLKGLSRGGDVVIQRKGEKALGYIIGEGVAKITVSTLPPTNPKEGDLWVKLI